MQRRQQRPAHGPLAGFTVGVTAARRADELGALLQRRGAAVLHAPALRIVPLADDSELLAATKELIDQAPDVVVATTAIGFRGWVEAADGWGLGEALLERLRGVELLARGPKVKGAIRAAGLTEEWSPGLRVDGRGARPAARARASRAAASPSSCTASRCPASSSRCGPAGAEVVGVPVYRWMPPEDIAPVDRLLDATVARGLDARHLHQRARRRLAAGPRRGPRAAARSSSPPCSHDVLPACVGPVTALPLQARGIHTVQPERFRLGPLVQLLCQELPGRRPDAARRRPPGRDPRPRRAGRRRAAAGAARRHGPAAGAGPPARLGGGPRRPAAGAARRGHATSTRWRRRWPGCARRWGRPS